MGIHGDTSLIEHIRLADPGDGWRPLLDKALARPFWRAYLPASRQDHPLPGRTGLCTFPGLASLYAGCVYEAVLSFPAQLSRRLLLGSNRILRHPVYPDPACRLAVWLRRLYRPGHDE